MATISIKRHWIILASLGVLLVAAVACGGGESGSGASGKDAIDPDAFRSFSGVSDNTNAATAVSGDAAPAATAAAEAAPAATAAPAAAPAATTAPATGSDSVVPSGEATIAVNAVNAGVGTPRFCTAGCAEDVYVAGIM
ncbi:MAG: hypothetical protein VB815_07565, partial [Dehalococcoidia bacterium]